MTRQQQQQQQQQQRGGDAGDTVISISPIAQIKMALHATKHGTSTNQVHGMVLGRSTNVKVETGGGGGGGGGRILGLFGGDDKDAVVLRRDVRVVDVVPVCHEVPTKPIVDMALRLVDAHLSQSSSSFGGGGTRIIGWYTANANAHVGGDGVVDDENEMPNPSACRIVSSLAECGRVGVVGKDDNGKGGDRCVGGGDGDVDDDYFVLLMVSTTRLVNCVRRSRDAHRDIDGIDDGDGGATNMSTRRRRCLPICAAFERPSSSSAFARRVDDACLRTTSTTMTTTAKTYGDDDGGSGGEKGKDEEDEEDDGRVIRAMANAIREQIRRCDMENDDGGGGYVYDFVDHMDDHVSGMDWIENGMANSLLESGVM